VDHGKGKGLKGQSGLEVRSEATVEDKMAKRHLNKKAVQATLDEKQKPWSAKGKQECFCRE
jgi:hypothetical protein